MNGMYKITIHIFNLSIQTSGFPELWKIAKVVPIYKSGSLDQPDSYRPIDFSAAGSVQNIGNSNSSTIDELLIRRRFIIGRSITQAAILFIDDNKKEVKLIEEI